MKESKKTYNNGRLCKCAPQLLQEAAPIPVVLVCFRSIIEKKKKKKEGGSRTQDAAATAATLRGPALSVQLPSVNVVTPKETAHREKIGTTDVSAQS